MHAWWLALTSMTRLSAPAATPGAAELTRARAWFPAVGAVVAGVAVAAFALADRVWGGIVPAVAAVAAGVVVTGALHEDGLADTVDGLWGGATPERRLEILRDPRLGTYGASALVLSLLLRVGLLAGAGLGVAARALVAGHVLGRASTLVLLARLDPARPDGLGAAASGPMGRGGAVLAAATTAAAAVAATGVWSGVVLAAAAVAYAACERAAAARLGGFTGDVLGATSQVVHVAVLGVVVGLAEQEVAWWVG